MYIILTIMLAFILASLEYLVGYSTGKGVIAATTIGAIIGAIMEVLAWFI